MRLFLRDIINIFKQIDRIDIYGQQISLKFKKQSEFKTQFGGLITLLVSLLTGLWTYVTVYQIVESTVLSIIENEVEMKKEDIYTIQLQPYLEHAFQIGLFQQQTHASYLQSQYYNFQAYYFQECDVVENKVEVSSSKDQERTISFKECSQLSNQDEDYKDLQNTMNGYFCFEKAESDYYPEVRQSLNCRESINIIVYKRQNLSESEVVELETNSLISIAMPNYLIDQQNVDNPFLRITHMTSFNVQKNSETGTRWKQLISINLQSVLLNDSKEFSLGEYKLIEQYKVESISTKIVNYALSNEEIAQLPTSIDEQDILFKVKIGFSQNKNRVQMTRYYQSIPTILGNLGGGIKILVLMGFLIVSPFTKLQFQKSILNEVFNFENEKDEDDGNYNNDNDQMEFLEKHIPSTIKQNASTLKSLEVKDQSQRPSLFRSNLFQTEYQNDAFSPIKRLTNQQLSKNKQINKDNLNNSNNNILLNKLQVPYSHQTINQDQFQYPLNNNINDQSRTNNNNNNLFTIQLVDQQLSPSVKSCVSRQSQKSKSIVPFRGLNFGSECYENNMMQKIQHKIGTKKNLVKDLIKEKILNNSSRLIGDSKYEIDIPSRQSINIPKNIATQLQINLQLQQQQEKKKLRDQKKLEDQIFEKYFKKTFNPLKISFLQSFFYYIWPFGRFKRTKQQINYSIEKLNFHLDSIYIIKKLLEIDKLKMLLLDEDQIKLLEYLPKPTINLNKVQTKKEEEEVSNNSSINSNEKDDFKKINIIYQDTRNDLKRTSQAFQAFQTIKSKKNINQIDRKLINLLDPKMTDFFNLGTEPIQIKSLTQQNNKSSQDNEMNKYNFENIIPENSLSYSQKIIKIETNQVNLQVNSTYLSSPLDIYQQRTNAKKASMFSHPTRQNKNQMINSAGINQSQNIDAQNQRYDEMEEDEQQLANSTQKSRFSIEKNSGECRAPSKQLIVIRSESNDLPLSLNIRKHNLSTSQGKKNDSSQNIKIKNASKMDRFLDKLRLNDESEQRSLDKSSVSQILGNDNDEKVNNTQQQIQDQTTQSIYSNIAEESIQIQTIDCNHIQFSLQNKFQNNPTLFPK